MYSTFQLLIWDDIRKAFDIVLKAVGSCVCGDIFGYFSDAWRWWYEIQM